jgi:ABC-type uncharacterized transport system permease subunit
MISSVLHCIFPIETVEMGGTWWQRLGVPLGNCAANEGCFLATFQNVVTSSATGYAYTAPANNIVPDYTTWQEGI